MAKKNEKKRTSRKKRRQGKSQCPAVQPGRAAARDARPSAAGPQPAPSQAAETPQKAPAAQRSELPAPPGTQAAAQAVPQAAKGPSAAGPAPQTGLAALWGTKPRKQTDAIRRPDGVFYRRRQWGRPLAAALIVLCVIGAVYAGAAAFKGRIDQPAASPASGAAPPAASAAATPTASPAPAPSPVPLSEAEFWDGVQTLLESSGDATLVKVDAGASAQAPQPVLAALFGRDVSLLIVWDGGEPILINGINMYRYTKQPAYPLSLLYDTYRGFVMEHSAAPADKPAFDLVFEG